MSFSEDSSLKGGPLHTDPITWFDDWYQKVDETDIDYPNAAALATVGSEQKPSSRIVLIKDYGPDGFIFYTNYRSTKADQIDENPNVSLHFYWRPLALQVRIEGVTRKTSSERSDTYFSTRPRGSQIGAWASNQSDELESRDRLEERYESFREKFEGQQVPRPEHWGGYKVIPDMFEFWKGRPDRLHDRWVFERDGDDWDIQRLYP